jgi:cyanophycin synthetase
VDAAHARGIPVRRRKNSLVQLGWGVNRRLVQAALTGRTSQIAVEIASDKSFTKELLREAYIPVPIGREVQSEAELAAAFTEIDRPVVIKPLDANQGKGVSLNVATLDNARAAFRIAQEFGRVVMVEEQFRGRDFRVLVIDGRVVAASERVPASVVGDGRHTVQELIDAANRDPRRGDGHDKPLTKIVLDAVAVLCLERRGIPLGFVPPPGERVFLRENANLSTGGEAHDVTQLLHPSVAELCVQAARVVGLDIAGIDLVARDITRPLGDGEGIIEVNAAPGLRMHVFPSEGQPVAAGAAVINSLFPPGSTGRIPIVAITGTNGKTTTARLIAHTLAATGRRVGLTSTDGIYLGGKCIGHADAAGPNSAHTVLSDPTIEAAVLETARGGLVRRGLAFDWCDVSVITNIRPDHIGQDGIRDLDDLIWIKSLIAERVREGGTLVINADDPGALAVLDRPRVRRIPRKVVLYSEAPDNPVVAAHLAAGGEAIGVRDGQIVAMRDGAVEPLVRIEDVPITFGGILNYNVSNCMAAIAASRALGVDEETAVAGARSFAPENNPGRGSIYELRGGYVMLDYGHNADAFTAVGQLRSAAAGHRLLGVVAVPGDRATALIETAGRAAAEIFDHIFIREDNDLRGRQPGETAAILCRGVHEVRDILPCEFVREGEVAALWRAVEQMKAGDLVVVFYDELEPLLEALAQAGARRVPPAEFARHWSSPPALAHSPAA